MSSFIDVRPFHWFYNDIEEVTNLRLKNNEGELIKFITGMPYNKFEDGKVAYENSFNVTTPSSEFIIDRVLTVTDESPLLCFVDDILVTVDSISILEVSATYPSGATLVKLARQVPIGAIILFEYVGVPEYSIDDPYERDVPTGVVYATQLPSVSLNIPVGFSYTYEPFSDIGTEIVKYNGIQLMRVATSNEVDDGSKYSIDEINSTISVHYSLNNKSIEGSFLILGGGLRKTHYVKLKPTSNSIIYTNRFFPYTYMSKAELVSLLDRLRKHFYIKYTDSLPPISTKTTSRFADVQTILDTNPNVWWWGEGVRDFEELYLSEKDDSGNNKPVLLGEYDSINDVYNLKPEDKVSRAEVAILINKMRKWFIESFS